MKTRQEHIEEMAKNVKKFITECFGEHCQCCGIVEKCYPYYFSKVAYHFGYRKASDVIDEFVERLKEENEISFRRYGKGIGISTIFRVADEMRQEVEK